MADKDKQDIGFNEALRRIANTPKNLIKSLDEKKKKAAPSKNKGAAKVNQSK